MRSLGANRPIVAGIVGIILGSVAEALINHLAGTTVVTGGMLWGAVLGILFASLPNFARMGALVTKSDKPTVHFIVGVVLFIAISLVIIVLFFGIFLLFDRLFS